jgi:hypothetical protein
VKKKAVSSYRPTGRLEPTPADLAYGALERAGLEYQARRGAIMVLYADETSLWRCALPRAGWWRTAPRARLPLRPLSPSQIKRAASLKRQAWGQYRAWSRLTSGVLLRVMGAVQSGTAKVCYTIGPPCDAQERRQYIHHVLATFRTTGTEVVRVVERSGIPRAHKLAATREHYHNKLRLHVLPAHGGPHRKPSEGFWRVMQDGMGAGRCGADLHRLYHRTRQVLMAHHERPIYALHW